MSDRPEGASPGVWRALGRGLSKRCPRCGLERIVEGFYRVRRACTTCGLVYERRPGDHVGVMYITTAVQTAMFAALALVVRPDNPWLSRVLLGGAALALFFLNMPNRKGFAIALDYVTGGDVEDGR